MKSHSHSMRHGTSPRRREAVLGRVAAIRRQALALGALALCVAGLDLGQRAPGDPACGGPILDGVHLAGMPYAEAGRSTNTGNTGRRELIFVLDGPNDGEPINARHLYLRITTSYASHGTVSVYVNDVYQTSKVLRPEAPVDAETGLQVCTVRLDMESIGNRMNRDFLAPGAPPVRVSAYLYDAATSRLVTFDEWQGRLRKPWIEFLSRTSLGAAVMLPPAKAAALIHSLPEDSYLFVLTSTSKDVLELSPENPELLRKARVVTALNCSQLGKQGVWLRNFLLLNTTLGSPARQAYVVLWTYDSAGGWKRSAISPVPRG